MTWSPYFTENPEAASELQPLLLSSPFCSGSLQQHLTAPVALTLSNLIAHSSPDVFQQLMKGGTEGGKEGGRGRVGGSRLHSEDSRRIADGAAGLCLGSISQVVRPCLCRCVVLSDPLKDSSRTQESWNAFLTKLRTLLLMSFTKNLGKFEDDMRTLREKRTEPGWSFCEYFMVQVLD